MWIFNFFFKYLVTNMLSYFLLQLSVFIFKIKDLKIRSIFLGFFLV